MGSIEERKPLSSLPLCKASDMEDKKLWDVAEKLQRLIVSHDKAVQQMYLLGKISTISTVWQYFIINQYTFTDSYKSEYINIDVCFIINKYFVNCTVYKLT